MAVAVTGASVLSECWEVAAKHTGCYTGGKISWTASSRTLSCLCSEELQLVDIATHKTTGRVAQENDGVLTYAVSPSGEHAVTSHHSGLLRHFRLGPPVELVRSWKAHDQVTADLAFDSTSAFLASGSRDFTVKVWDFVGYFCTHVFRGHKGIVRIVRFHPTQLQVASIADEEARLWDLKTSTCIGIMKDHMSAITSACFARLKGSNYSLVTGGRDQVVCVWPLEGRAKVLPTFESVESIAVIPTKSLQAAAKLVTSKDSFVQWLGGEDLPAFVILTVGEKNELRVLNPADGKTLRSETSPHAAKGLMLDVLFLEGTDGLRVLTAGVDCNLVLWSVPEFTPLTHIMGYNEDVVHVQFIPSLSWSDPQQETEGAHKELSVTADTFVCVVNDEMPRVVSKDGFGARLLKGHTANVIACDVSVDGQWIATGGKDQSLRVWNASTYRCVCVLTGHAGSVSAVSFPKKRPKGPNSVGGGGPPWCLATGSEDKTMKIWELPPLPQLESVSSTGATPIAIEKAKVTVIAGAKEVNDLTVAPNNKVVASGGQDKLIRIWRFPEADLLGECKGHRRGIWHVAFSPVDQVHDGKTHGGLESPDPGGQRTTWEPMFPCSPNK